MKKKNLYLLSKIILILILAIFLNIAQKIFDPYVIRIMNLCGIYTILGVSLNLINGFTGQFSLGHAGFMSIGAYVSALLYMSPKLKVTNFFITPIIWPLSVIHLPFFISVIAAGIVAALIGALVGAPCLRLKGDYLAIVTFGFSEIIRIVFCNLQNITNGPLGLKGLPAYTNLWWSWGGAIVTIYFISNLINSSYGRALKSIREDEEAAEAMGVYLFYHKVLSFVVGAFFAGIGGALLGSLVMTIDPNVFNVFMTFQIILIIIVGGLGSITGTVIIASSFTILMELLRSVESPMNFFGIQLPAIPGMRMLIFSVILMVFILFFKRGLMGGKEFSLKQFINIFYRDNRTIKEDN